VCVSQCVLVSLSVCVSLSVRVLCVRFECVQSYGLFSSHVQMYDLDHEEG